MFNFANPLYHSLLLVQIIGFPVIFIQRAIVRFLRMRRGEERLRERNRLEAIANVCFALTSIAFPFTIIVAVVLFVAGIVLAFRAFKSAPYVVPVTAVGAVGSRRRKQSNRKVRVAR